MEKMLEILQMAKPEIDIEKALSTDDLYGKGIIDSLDVFIILDEINAAYGIEIGGGDFTRNDFKTVESLSELVERHSKGA